MARLNEEGQWIVLMGLLVAVALFFLALIVNQSTIVGQTTAEGVLEFPKNDVRDLRRIVFDCVDDGHWNNETQTDITEISLYRKNAIVDINVSSFPDLGPGVNLVTIHYNNGVTVYDEATYR